MNSEELNTEFQFLDKVGLENYNAGIAEAIKDALDTKADASTTQESINNINSEISTLNGTVGTLSGTVGTLSRDINVINSSIGNINARIDGLPTVPQYAIFMWDENRDIPTGYSLCDGQGGRPDLQNLITGIKFIIKT